MIFFQGRISKEGFEILLPNSRMLTIHLREFNKLICPGNILPIHCQRHEFLTKFKLTTSSTTKTLS